MDTFTATLDFVIANRLDYLVWPALIVGCAWLTSTKYARVW